MPKLVSIILPCRNEEKCMAACLDSVLEQDYPKDALEVLIADGASTDGTRGILEAYAARYPLVRWFDNPAKTVPAALNVLVRQARGRVIVRMDAHAVYPGDYVSKCVGYLESHGADNVGGLCLTVPAEETPEGRAIAAALSSGFGVGNSLFRTGGITEPQPCDTVPFGCFRREVFDRIGLFDEDLVRNQDDEFNSRLIKNGGKVLLVPQIVSKYYARSSWRNLWRMYSQYGYFKPLAALKLGAVMTARQLVPALFVASLACGLLAFPFLPLVRGLLLLEVVLYAAANFAASLYDGLRRRDPGSVPHLMVSFFIIHCGYGLGYLSGIVDFVLLKKHLKHKMGDVALSR